MYAAPSPICCGDTVALDAETMITKEYPLKQASGAYAASESGHEVKVLIRI